MKKELFLTALGVAIHNFASEPNNLSQQLLAHKLAQHQKLDQQIATNNQQMQEILAQCRQEKQNCNTELHRQLMLENALLRSQVQKADDALDPAINFLQTLK